MATTSKLAVRELSATFMNELRKEGILHPILKRIQEDHTLMLAIRENYINIYYRGGNLLKIKEVKKGRTLLRYETDFNKNYDRTGLLKKPLPKTITNLDDANTWVANFPILKQIMDFYFSDYQKPEREFQQLIARENNYSTISNQSEYFIADIEFADSSPENKSRFDMLAIRWLAKNRKDGSNCEPALIEVKYGDGAMSGAAGLDVHLADIDAFISDGDKYAVLLKTIEKQIEQLHKLGLLKCNGLEKEKTKVKLDKVNKDDKESKPEVIFILANHNPRSKILDPFINALVKNKKTTENFDLKFFVASASGYAMHSDCMFSLEKFQTFLALQKK